MTSVTHAQAQATATCDHRLAVGSELLTHLLQTLCLCAKVHCSGPKKKALAESIVIMDGCTRHDAHIMAVVAVGCTKVAA